ncbi:MAG: serine/threonine-protein kinase [Polyangiaceae bacterium]
MQNSAQAEVRIALAEGLLSETEASHLAQEAEALGKSPLDLMLERGRISQESHASLCAHRLSPPPSGPPPPADPAVPPELATFPAPGWDRYEPVALLGKGGMGRVFLARDLRLGREVALKLVLGDDPELARRFVREARAQARIDHPRVCKVFEVGEIRGKVYIAMQHIRGAPLSAAAPDLSFIDKATALRDAALGAQAAHDQGLIHRDIKPSNILVERTAAGPIEAVVVDFGLARSAGAGETVTGSVLGTPHYMAPEQARGEVDTLDFRVDIYGLGAALYALLTGRPLPGRHCRGGAPPDRHHGAPRPPLARSRHPPGSRSHCPQVPGKGRSARYGSASELAAELDRFLAGEPILSLTPPSLSERASAGGSAVNPAGLPSSPPPSFLRSSHPGWGSASVSALPPASARPSTSPRSPSRSSPALDAPLSPAPTTSRPDRKALLTSVASLESEVLALAPSERGPGLRALGRASLAAGDDARAADQLEAAWEQGDRDPHTAYSIALVRARLYQRELLQAERLPSPAERAARKAEVVRRHRDQVLWYLRRSEGAGIPSVEYVAALVAYCEERFDDALSHATAAGEGRPWFYEAPKLRGDILLAGAFQKSASDGGSPAPADLDAAREAYKLAAAAAESVPEIHEALAELEYSEMLLQLYGKGDVLPAPSSVAWSGGPVPSPSTPITATRWSSARGSVEAWRNTGAPGAALSAICSPRHRRRAERALGRCSFPREAARSSRAPTASGATIVSSAARTPPPS